MLTKAQLREAAAIFRECGMWAMRDERNPGGGEDIVVSWEEAVELVGEQAAFWHGAVAPEPEQEGDE